MECLLGINSSEKSGTRASNGQGKSMPLSDERGAQLAGGMRFAWFRTQVNELAGLEGGRADRFLTGAIWAGKSVVAL